MKIWIMCVFLILGFTKQSKSEYAVNLIPKNLLSKAGAVIRNSEEVVEIKQLDEVYRRHKLVITILNISEIEEATLAIFYDKTTSVKSAKGIIYNEMGVPILKISEKQFQDRSAVSGGSLYEDDRVKYFRPANVSYPFTIEYEYETKTKQSLMLPSWIPINSEGIAVEKSSMTFIYPESFKLRYKEFNFKGKAEELISDGTKTLKWHLENLNALRQEPFSPNLEEFLVMVKFAPEKFAYKNIKGSFVNWQEFGSWMSENLLKGRNEVPEATKAYVQSLIKDVQDPKERAKKIYSYLQAKKRYISVQVGIGGWQPYSAEEVDRLGYGDCKGLTNYMHSLLKLAGVESYYTLVYAGKDKRNINPDFASIQGNHAILCVPFKNDTTWLECTSKDAPFGFLGDFTDDRYVLACTPDGGKIMRTPKLAANDNRQLRTAAFKISSDGTISGKMTTSFTGAQYENHDVLLNEAYAEQVKKIPELYPLPNLHINSFEFKQKKDSNPEAKEVIDLISGAYCNLNGGKLYLKINGINQIQPIREVRNRMNSVRITRGFYDEDNISYELPEGYKTDLTQKSIVVEKPFGKYTAEIQLKGNVISYKRTMLLDEGTYSANQYEDLVNFHQEIADADNLVAILSKTN